MLGNAYVMLGVGGDERKRERGDKSGLDVSAGNMAKPKNDVLALSTAT